MGGSARYRYGKKIANAIANGESEDRIAELRRQQEEAIAREKARKAERAQNQTISLSDNSLLSAYSTAKFISSMPSGISSSPSRRGSVLAPESNGILEKALGISQKRNKETDEFSKDKITRISKDVFEQLSPEVQKWSTNEGDEPKCGLKKKRGK